MREIAGSENPHADKQAAEVNRERLQSEQEGTLRGGGQGPFAHQQPEATFPLARTEGAPDSLPPPACRARGNVARGWSRSVRAPATRSMPRRRSPEGASRKKPCDRNDRSHGEARAR